MLSGYTFTASTQEAECWVRQGRHRDEYETQGLPPQEVMCLRLPGALPEVLGMRSTEIADAVTNEVSRHVITSSEWLTAEHKRSAIMQARMVKRVLELAASGEPFSDNDLGSYRGVGVLFARHRVPLPLLLASFDTGTSAMVRESWRIVPSEYFTGMAQFTERVARMLKEARKTAVHGYLDTRAESNSRSARRIAAEALIGGESAPAARVLGERLAPSYLVLACALPDSGKVDTGTVAAIYRDIESVPGALHSGDLSILVVLLPVEDSQPLPEAAAAELAGRVRALTGLTVYATQAHRPDLAGIPAALDEACRALSLVKAIPDAGCKPYRLDALLVELAIARQPDITRRLAALLTPLDAGPDLRRTLEVLFACDLDRERTARELCIHRRTLRYRMDRIRNLSGVNPDSAHGIQLFRAALTATRMLPPGGPRPEKALP
jgi:hypothetical protein